MAAALIAFAGLRMRTLAVRMRPLASFLSPAALELLLVRAPGAVFAPVLLIGLSFPLTDVTHRVLFLLPAVRGFVPRIATVVAFAFKLSTFCTSNLFPVTITTL